MKKLVWGRADAIVVHSIQDSFIVAREYDNRVVIIPHGVYDQYGRVKDSRIPTNRFEVLFFGLVRDYKGVDYLIKGFRDANLNAHLWIVGEGWDDLDEHTNDLNVFRVSKYLDDKGIVCFFSSVDVVVLPYLRASSSGVAHIAMHYGLPIIATKVGGLAELDDYEGMLYVPPADSEAIADRLKFVHDNWRGKRFPVPKRLEWSEIKKEWDSLFSLV